eukprot:GHVL01018964.1.p1 GENE.GHVL01018964.1~~GHVL01018964.1.p1  ORF type:complete len:767 (+),score=144.51 GHVL01018964.1:23-2323(+)
MGFLDVGLPLDWRDSKKYINYVKEHGIAQFLNIFNLNKSRIDTDLKWGEELEFTIVALDATQRTAKLLLAADALLPDLTANEEVCHGRKEFLKSDWHPEYANYMIEAIPTAPYSSDTLDDLLKIEPSMEIRRHKIDAALSKLKRDALQIDNNPYSDTSSVISKSLQLHVTSLTAFPTLGMPESTLPESYPDSQDSTSRSIFLSDDIITPHPRFKTLTGNIRRRRKAKISILVPIYKDVNTCSHPCWDNSVDIKNLSLYELTELSEETPNPVKDHIYMDCMGFGMGLSCLQATFLAPTMSDARYLYDQLTVLAPFFLSLTASSPVLRGMLADTDSRWEVIGQSVDCRTKEDRKTIPKSRYSGVSYYIADSGPLLENFEDLNDTNPPINNDAYVTLLKEGVDPILSRHIAHLFIRDPMVIFKDAINIDDTKSVAHFENIQSTNWNSVRFKPPPASLDGTSPSQIGWRVEFRTPELQMTDFENAAVSAVVAVIVKLILKKEWDLYIPISLCDENMIRSEKRNSVLDQKFWYRQDIMSKNREVVEKSLKEIFFGNPKETGRKGLFDLVEECVSEEFLAKKCSNQTFIQMKKYINFFNDRLNGNLMTNSAYWRQFIARHRDYKKDSLVTSSIAHDMCDAAVNVGKGLYSIPEVHGAYLESSPCETLDIRDVLMDSDRSRQLGGHGRFWSSDAWGWLPHNVKCQNDYSPCCDYSVCFGSSLVSQEDVTQKWIRNRISGSCCESLSTVDDYPEDLNLYSIDIDNMMGVLTRSA